jgi:hypothetical protein
MKQDNPDRGPTTWGYDNTHILIAVLIVCGVIAAVLYVYTSYTTPDPLPATHTTAPAVPAPTGQGPGVPARP